MANRLRQTVQSIQEGTPAEQRMDAGGPAPNLTKGLAGGLQSVVEILGPQADIAAMVEEAKRAESSFTKGDYMDAAGSAGLAAIIFCACFYAALPWVSTITYALCEKCTTDKKDGEQVTTLLEQDEDSLSSRGSA